MGHFHLVVEEVLVVDMGLLLEVEEVDLDRMVVIYSYSHIQSLDLEQ